MGAYASPNGARRYVSFESVETGGERRRRFERETEAGRTYCLRCMPERVVVWRESLRVRVMRIGEGVTSLERGEWNGAGVVSVAFAK